MRATEQDLFPESVRQTILILSGESFSVSRRDQSMAIDHRKSNRSIDTNRCQLINCYQPIDDQSIITSLSPQMSSIAIDCYRLSVSAIDHAGSVFIELFIS